MRRVSLVVLAALAVAAPCLAARAEVIRLRADAWCPYNCDPGSDRPGYMIEIARAAFAAAGHTVDYRTLNWGRTIAEARAGRVDGVVGAGRTDVPDFVLPGLPLGRFVAGFAVRRGTTFAYEGPKSFEGRVLGAIVGYTYDPEIDAYLQAHLHDRARVEFTAGEGALRQNLLKLVNGRLDLVVEDVNVIRMTLRDAGLEDAVVVAGNLPREERDNLYIAFSPASPRAADHAALLTRGVAAMRADGRLAAILARYGLKDWR